MKILYICHRFPFPPKRGGKIRPFNMIRHLSRSHEVTVASMVRSDPEADHASGIAPYCHRFVAARVRPPTQAIRMLLRVPTSVPSSMGFFYSRSLAGTIDQELLLGRGFDLGEADGRLGLRSRAAIRDFQVSAGLVPDGFATADILARLRNR